MSFVKSFPDFFKKYYQKNTIFFSRYATTNN